MSHNVLVCIPYCYFIGWPEMNKFYYGVKFGTNANPQTFWKTYFSSSELVLQYRKQFGEPTLILIRKVFDPVQYGSVAIAQKLAVDHESKVIRRMRMVADDRFLNASVVVDHRTGDRIENHKKYRHEKYGQYHSSAGVESMREFNRIYSKNNNPMHRPEVRLKHLDSMARKMGYIDHSDYLTTIRSAFEKYKTIKETSEKTGHSQYAIRHLLLGNFGKEWVDLVRRDGLSACRKKAALSNKNRPKESLTGERNYNAYVWRAISPTGEVVILKGNRLQFCKERAIGTCLDPNKPHLRGFWQFEKVGRATVL